MEHVKLSSQGRQPGVAPPSDAVKALFRLGYGPRQGDIAAVESMGLQAYVDQQLNPNPNDDPDCLTRIANATLRIAYGSVDEMRPLSNLNAELATLWPISKNANYAERIRPADEVRAATWLRAIYSRWQLFEVLCEFWHNHFNVNAYSDSRIAATWPLYDRTVIRAHALGNFRQLLGATAKSTAMLYYLDNAVSRDGPANENYARELFELHALGAEHYYNHIYDDWTQVPQDEQGRPLGYIDQDVYEAARAFTGWTVADGRSLGSGASLPDTGAFTYVDQWNDNALKIVLATFLSANQGPMVHGEKVLDLLAEHPATARTVCTKLCQRLVSDTPPQALIDQAVAVWLANVNDPEQIKKTVRAIILAPEFLSTWGPKIRRPFECFAAFLRATNANVMPDSSLFYRLENTGYRMFSWQPPTGHPDTVADWGTSNTLLQTWNGLNTMVFNSASNITIDLIAQQPPSATTVRQITAFWCTRLLGREPAATTLTRLHSFFAQGGDPDQPPVGSASEILLRTRFLVHLIAMIPEFYAR